jgi:hypothetical protein
MQWLIDLIVAAVGSEIGYFDRGDTSAWDFTIGDLTVDGDWHEIDLSSIVPDGATAVSLKVNIRNTTFERKFELRKSGNSDEYCSCVIWSQVANVRIGAVYPVSCSTDRKVDYRFVGGGWNLCNIQVNGWWQR